MKTVKVEPLANVHSHQREGDVVGPLIARSIEGGADVLLSMPNTNDGLTTAQQVLDYTKDLTFLASEYLTSKDADMQFIPTLMINEATTTQVIDDCIAVGIMNAKIYPLNRTTKSHNGVRDYSKLLPVIKHCGEVHMKVHFHPEHPWMMFTNRDAEYMFLPIVDMFLRETEAMIIWEHGTDARCIPFWKEMAKSFRFFVTLTAHHLVTNEDLSFGDVKTVCKPPVKTEDDRKGLVDLVMEDHIWVMAGGDDAFHDITAKHKDVGCCACGAYTAPFLLPLYAHALDELLFTKTGVKTFINFTSRNARKLHLLVWPDSPEVTLARNSWTIPRSYEIGNETVLPFWAGQQLNWAIVG